MERLENLELFLMEQTKLQGDPMEIFKIMKDLNIGGNSFHWQKGYEPADKE